MLIFPSTQTPDGQKIVKRFNQLATVLVKYEKIFYKHWNEQIEEVVAKASELPLLCPSNFGCGFRVNMDAALDAAVKDGRFVLSIGYTAPEKVQRLLAEDRATRVVAARSVEPHDCY